MISPLTIPSNLRFPNLHPHPVTPLFPYPTLFRSVSEHLLKPLELNVTFRRHFRGRCQFAQVCQILVEPLAIRPAPAELSLDLRVTDYTAFQQVDQKHPARLQATFLDDVRRVDVEDAGFRCQHTESIFRDRVAGRTQPVAV